eukprot:8990010-Alexandrium_andersonii.AAC.1
MRNTHLRAILGAPGGPHALTSWANLLAAGKAPQHVLQFFLQATVVPLSKPSGVARPIVLWEVALK